MYTTIRTCTNTQMLTISYYFIAKRLTASSYPVESKNKNKKEINEDDCLMNRIVEVLEL